MSSNWVKFAEKSGVKIKLSPVTNTCMYCSLDKYWSGLCWNHYRMWYNIYWYLKTNSQVHFGDIDKTFIEDYIKLLKKYEPEKYAELIAKIQLVDIIK